MLVIFSRPQIAAEAQAWIDRIRAAHDPQHAIIGAHVTLVFPFDGLPVGQVVAHVRTVAAEASPLEFRLDRATAVPDAFAPQTHVFLTPGAGARRLRRLHRRLYSGVLAPKLDRRAPFRPHLTLARHCRHAPDAEAQFAWPARELVLYSSENGPHGVHYRAIGRWPLDGERPLSD